MSDMQGGMEEKKYFRTVRVEYQHPIFLITYTQRPSNGVVSPDAFVSTTVCMHVPTISYRYSTSERGGKSGDPKNQQKRVHLHIHILATFQDLL
jgi:hypothetical protein